MSIFWNFGCQSRKRKRWTSPLPECRNFSSLPKAIAFATRHATTTSPSKSQTKKKQKTSTSNKKANPPFPPPSASKETSIQLQQDDTTNNSINQQQIISLESNLELDEEPDPETNLDYIIPPKSDSTSHSSTIDHPNSAVPIPSQKNSNRATTVYWDPYGLEGSRIGFRIRLSHFLNYYHTISPYYFDHNRKNSKKRKLSPKKNNRKKTQSKKKDQEWSNGRILRYDPVSNKFKILIFDETVVEDDDEEEVGDIVWIHLPLYQSMQHPIHMQCAGDFVWAQVKGFAWWPAQVLDCVPNNISSSGGVKNVLVEFFGSDQVATLKRHDDSIIRPFNYGKQDEIVSKHKKKKNALAIKLAVQEQKVTRDVRNAACLFYARRAFSFYHAKSQYLIGQRIELFRPDLNYPNGLRLKGTIRQYSALHTKKYLIVYDNQNDDEGDDYNNNDDSDRMDANNKVGENRNQTNNKKKANSQNKMKDVFHEPTWVNLQSKECNYTILTHQLENDQNYRSQTSKVRRISSLGNNSSVKIEELQKYQPTEEDLLPFIFGYEKTQDAAKVEDQKCLGCLQCLKEKKHDQRQTLTCTRCHGSFHLGCLDPPISTANLRKIQFDKNGNGSFTCSRCVKCVGCQRYDISFGCKTMLSKPPSLYLERNSSLNLCSNCIDLYENERFCPSCAHVWDDTKYQQIQRILKWERSQQCTLVKGSVRATAETLQAPISKFEKDDATSTMETDMKCTIIIDNVDQTKCEDTSETNKKGRNENNLTPQSAFKNNEVEADSQKEKSQESSFHSWVTPSTLDPTFYYPDSSIWGYNEGAMVICEDCNLWVHAKCANLTEKCYEQTNAGKHPIYSKEFLCRLCCKKRCRELIISLQKEDKMFMFATPVTDKMAHNYHDIIKNPMDLQTMLERVDLEDYCNYAWVRESFELMVYNALTFNRGYSSLWKEATRFYKQCLQKIFSTRGIGAPESKYGKYIQGCFHKAERDLIAEKERVQKDDKAEKKDLVAGTDLEQVEIKPPVNPCDPKSFANFKAIRLRKVDAFYSSWMECCFMCGSSGAADTMLFCVDCGEAYHSFCVLAPIHSMNHSSVSGWRCTNCKICEISGTVPLDETKLLYCEMCDRAYSIDLIEPPLKEVPKGLWICGQCVDCKECQNNGDKGKVSKKYWSRDPEKCFRCGGCEGLVEDFTEGRLCNVCNLLSRPSEPALVQCHSCKENVHLDCDKFAIEVLDRRKKLSEQPTDKKQTKSGKQKKVRDYIRT